MTTPIKLNGPTKSSIKMKVNDHTYSWAIKELEQQIEDISTALSLLHEYAQSYKEDASDE